MTKRVFVCLAVALLVLPAVPAVASTFVAMGPVQLVRQADSVVQGRVLELNTFWSDDGRMMITEALMEVDEVIVGQAPQRVKVRTFGGQIGEVKVEAIGFPQFQRDEQVLLFLKRNPVDASLRVLGYQQGQFRVVTRLDGVTLAVPMVEEGARFITPNGKLMPEPSSMRLDTFKAGIRDQAARLGRPVVK